MFPVVAIVIYCSVLYSVLDDGVLFLPPPNTPRVGDETHDTFALPSTKTPKSEALPVVAIVTNSITSVKEGEAPPANIPRVEDPILATPLLATVASPKSVELHKIATYTKSIEFNIVSKFYNTKIWERPEFELFLENFEIDEKDYMVNEIKFHHFLKLYNFDVRSV